MKNIGSRRGWVRSALTGYRAFWISVPRTWVPRQEPRRGTFVMVIPCPTLPHHFVPCHRGYLSNPSLTLPRSIPVVLNDQVFSSYAWRSSSRPSCHPIREGGISPDPRLRQRNGNLDKEGGSVEELARAYIDGYIILESLLICLRVLLSITYALYFINDLSTQLKNVKSMYCFY